MLECVDVSVRGILKHINFKVREKSFTVILGKNGSGKTTLAKCIMSQCKYIGCISLDDLNIYSCEPEYRATMISYLPQSLPSPNITVRELVTMGRNPHMPLGGKLQNRDNLAIEKAMHITYTDELADRFIPTLSGGEKQRAFLAMMLATDAEILLLDEPCAYMDMAAEAEFMRLLASLDKTLIVITHNLSLAAKHASDVLVLDSGKQVFFGGKDECLKSNAIEKVFNVRRIENNGAIIFSI